MVVKEWPPTRFIRYEDTVWGSSTGPAIITTDAGRAYLKAINNPMGPHALAREWVGAKLARLFGLEIFEMAILFVSDYDEIPIKGGLAAPGPALLTREVKNGFNWGGDPKELDIIENPDGVTRLVVFDTWTRNKDRHPPSDIDWSQNYDNVFFSPKNAAAGRFRLIAMDHSECFLGPLNARMATIDRVKDDRIYGLFDAFKPLMDQETLFDTIDRLRQVDRFEVSAIVGELPKEWDVNAAAAEALVSLIMERADYLADNLVGTLGAEAWPGELLFRGGGNVTR